MARLFLKHITSFSYSNYVVESYNQIMLYPYNDFKQQVINHSINVTGNPTIHTSYDCYNNKVGFFNFSPPHNQMTIESQAEISVNKIELPTDKMKIADQWSEIEKLKSDTIDFFQFTSQVYSSETKALECLKKIHQEPLTPFNLLMRLNEFVFNKFNYKKGVTNVDTSVEKVWKLGSGVCQDFTNILIQLCRLSNIPARYVSGYVCSSERIRGDGATHSWVEAYIPGYGWIGVDPTNNCICHDLHVKVGVGRNYSDCAPVKGIYKGDEEQKMEVKVVLSKKKLKLREPFQLLNEDINKKNNINSYQKNMEMIQQQQ